MFTHAFEGSTIVIRQMGTPTQEEARAQIALVRGILDAKGSAALLLVVRGTRGVPSAETREIYRSVAGGRGRVSAVAVVVLQTGLVGQLVRAAAKATLALVAGNKPVAIFRDVGAAARWLASRGGGDIAGLVRAASAEGTHVA